MKIIAIGAVTAGGKTTVIKYLIDRMPNAIKRSNLRSGAALRYIFRLSLAYSAVSRSTSSFIP